MRCKILLKKRSINAKNKDKKRSINGNESDPLQLEIAQSYFFEIESNQKFQKNINLQNFSSVNYRDSTRCDIYLFVLVYQTNHYIYDLRSRRKL